jgi:hypothetical protein
MQLHPCPDRLLHSAGPCVVQDVPHAVYWDGPSLAACAIPLHDAVICATEGPVAASEEMRGYVTKKAHIWGGVTSPVWTAGVCFNPLDEAPATATQTPDHAGR